MHPFHTYVFIKPLLERSLQLFLLQIPLQAGAYNCFLLQMLLQAVAHIYVSTFLSKEVGKYTGQSTLIKIPKLGCPGRFSVLRFMCVHV